MAQDRLIACGAGVVLMAGTAVELYSASSFTTGLLDWVIGAGWTVAAVRGHRPGGQQAALGLLTAAAWFLPTGLAAAGAGATFPIAFRGPLLHWMTLRFTSTSATIRGLVVTGYLAALVGTTGAAVVTGLVALALATLLFRSSRRER